MSSVIYKWTSDLIKLNGYPLNIVTGIRKECYKSQNNKYYKNGMSTNSLLKTTFNNEKNICMTLSFNKVDDDVLELIKNHKVNFIMRQNVIDVFICRYKDFMSKKPENIEFHDWRNSRERNDKLVKTSNDNVIKSLSTITKLEKKNRTMKKHFKQKEMIVAEKLCNQDFDEWSKLFKNFGLKLKKNIFDLYFKDIEIKKRTPNQKSFIKNQRNSLKEKLKQHNYIKYWQE